MDFSALSGHLLNQIRTILPSWLPGGKVRGNEYVCGSVRGEKGDSFSVNLSTGAWADFATSNVRGGDLISLYAAINNLRQGEAFKILSETYQPSLLVAKQEKTKTVEPAYVPDGMDVPEMNHPNLGKPSCFWTYKDKSGRTMFYIARYNEPTCVKCGENNIDKVCPKCGAKQKKELMPWCWVPKFKNFRSVGWPTPRPLYGLDTLSDKPIMIVEGEKTAESARKLIGEHYDVVTWPNGAQSTKKTDWSPAFGQQVVIWPDADEQGVKAAYSVADILSDKCPSVKIIDIQGQKEGWDAADALEEGMTTDSFFEWAKPRTKKYEPVAELVKDKPTEVDEEQQANISKTVYSIWEELGLARSNNGSPITNMDNVLRVIESAEEFKDFIWYDDFHCKYFTKWKTGIAREWSDIDELKLTQFFQRELGFSKMSDEIINKAVRVYAHKNAKNEPKDWMNSLVWDKTPRIDTFFHDLMGAHDDKYTRSASKNWWISMAARVFNPGCQVDTMVIFEGPQGKFKSTAVAVIGGKWYSEAHESVTSKDFFMLLQGKLIIEISELDAFRKAEINTIKKVITCRTDRYRPPYGRTTQDFKRQSVFVGTTNEDAYLQDNSGARRFWPIKTGEIKIKEIKDNREQLFAEAVERFKSGEPWHEMPLESAAAQEQRRIADEWEHIIERWISTHDYGDIGYTIEDIADQALKISPERLDRVIQLRIGKALRVLGFERRVVRRGQAIVNRWLKKEQFVDYRIDEPPF